MFKRYYATLMLLLAATTVESAVPVVLERGVEHLLQSENIEYLATDYDENWMSITRDELSTDWKRPETSTLNLWLPEKIIWVRIPLVNEQQNNDAITEEFLMEIRWPMLQDIELRVWSDSEFGEVSRSGQHYSLSDITFLDKNVTFPISIKSGEEAYVYLKVIENHLTFLPIVIWDKNIYSGYSDKRLIIFSICLGILIIMVLYNFLLGVFTKDKMYFFYSVAVLALIFYCLASTGYGRMYLWGKTQWMTLNAYSISTPLAFLTITYFFRLFLHLERYGGWIIKSNNFFIVFWVAVLIINVTPLQNIGLALMIPGGVAVTILGMWIATYLWTKGNPSAKFFVLAWTGVCVSTFIIICILAGVITYFPAVEFIQTGSFIIEAVLLSVALAERISREREEKELAQAEVIDQKSSILIMQEKANVELEKNVRSRTLELAKALTDLERANEELARVSTVDPLTQLYNRGYFDEAAVAEISRCSRTGASMSMILIDIDHFKEVNDTYGHVVGDKCLKLVAQCILKVVSRASDVVARYGGEEFAVILPDTIEKNALLVAERIRKAVSEIAFINDGKAIKLTASFGVVGRTIVKGDTVEGFVNSADTALYLAKDNGRDRVEAAVLAVKN